MPDRNDTGTQVFSTGIEALDSMLGGGLSPGLILLRGDPGTGKTTLAIQVLENALLGVNGTSAEAMNTTSRAPAGLITCKAGCFVSLEREPEDVLRHMETAFRGKLRAAAGRDASVSLARLSYNTVQTLLGGSQTVSDFVDALVKIIRNEMRLTHNRRLLRSNSGKLGMISANADKVGGFVASLRSFVTVWVPIRNSINKSPGSKELWTHESNAGGGRRAGVQLSRKGEKLVNALEEVVNNSKDNSANSKILPQWRKEIANPLQKCVDDLRKLAEKGVPEPNRHRAQKTVKEALDLVWQSISRFLSGVDRADKAKAVCIDALKKAEDELGKDTVDTESLEKVAVALEETVKDVESEYRTLPALVRSLSVNDSGRQEPLTPSAGSPEDEKPEGELVVLDSLGALSGLFEQCFRQNTDAALQAVGRTGGHSGAFSVAGRVREFLHLLSRKMVSPDGRLAFLAIGERHDCGAGDRSIAGESFISDTEIELRSEPVVRTIQNADHIGRFRPEQRFFCRVLKSRETNRQVRRCSYDFVADAGVVFYHTYPGDGKVYLFQENEPQQREWSEFQSRDVSEQYPSLAFDTFDRNALQRVFASRRRRFHMPERTDMHLSSLDMHWLKWYAQICQRTRLASEARRLDVECAPESSAKHARFSQLMGYLHKMCMEEARKLVAGIAYELREKGLYRDGNIPVVDCFPPIFGADAPATKRVREMIREKIDRIATVADEVEPEGLRIVDLAREILADEVLVAGVRAKIDEFPCCQQCVEEKGAEEVAKCGERVAALLRDVWSDLVEEQLLEPLPSSQLRLGGERRSPLVKELRSPEHTGGCPPYKHFGNPFEPALLAVPYNANVGLFVCRANALGALLAQEVTGSCEEQIEQLTKRIEAAYKALWQCPSLPERVPGLIQGLAERLVDGELPQTWEEVIAICSLSSGHECLQLETQTFDTFLCTFLEMLWSFGADFSVDESYSVQLRLPGSASESRVSLGANGELLFPAQDGDQGHSELNEVFARPLRLLRHLFGSNTTARDCSVSPDYLVRAMERGQGEGTGQNWLFARHWYSTLVEALTQTVPGNGPNRRYLLWDKQAGEARDRDRLALMRVPLALDELLRQLTTGQGWQEGRPTEEQLAECVHHSCWGVWSLGLLKGSENKALGVELINNLMSSQKVVHRAEVCAAVPTVEFFYELYGRSRCINLPGRDQISLPEMNWEEFRHTFFRGARSRTRIFDYRHTIVELHSILELVRHTARIEGGACRPEDAEIDAALEDALRRVLGLNSAPILTH